MHNTNGMPQSMDFRQFLAPQFWPMVNRLDSQAGWFAGLHFGADAHKPTDKNLLFWRKTGFVRNVEFALFDRLLEWVPVAAMPPRLFVTVSMATLQRDPDACLERLVQLQGHVSELVIEIDRIGCDLNDPRRLMQFVGACRERSFKIASDISDAPLGTEQEALRHALGPSYLKISALTFEAMYRELGGPALISATGRLRASGAKLICTNVDEIEMRSFGELAGADFFVGRAVGLPCEVPGQKPNSVVEAEKAVAGRRLSIGALALSTAVVASCSSVPVPATPDGSSRVPVNDPARVSRLQDDNKQMNALAEQRSQERNQVSALRKELNNVRQALALLLLSGELNTGAAPRAQVQPGAATAPADAEVPAQKAGSAVVAPEAKPVSLTEPKNREVQLGDGAVIFRSFEDVGATSFEPSARMAGLLMEAAKEAQYIEVRGRTDSYTVDEANKRVALGRALDARKWLIEQGVEASRIRTRYTSAGRFLVPNGTPQGKALNRRVEIEMRGDMSRVSSLVGKQQEG